jgi:hypothetical protein
LFLEFGNMEEENIKEIKVRIKKPTQKKAPIKVETPREKGARRRKELADLSKIGAGTCRYCMKAKGRDAFWVTTNPYIDRNGRMSICIECIKKIYTEMLHTTNGDEEQAIYATCQQIDLLFDKKCIESAKENFLTDDEDNNTLIARYWKAVHVNYIKQNIRWRDTKLTQTVQSEINSKTLTAAEKKELQFKWGIFDVDEYRFLESIYKEYSEAFGVNGPNERDGYKTLAILLLRQRSNPENKDIINAIKAQYELLGIDPKQLRKESKEKGTRTLGIDISIMEKTEPAEYIEDKGLYFDYDGLEKDLAELKRAQKNHLTGSRDFASIDLKVDEVEEDE